MRVKKEMDRTMSDKQINWLRGNMLKIKGAIKNGRK